MTDQEVNYADDFSKHAPVTDIPKIRWIWDSVPVQLAKENNKFVFSHVKEGKRSAELEDALQWLCDAGLIIKTELVEKPELPLAGFADKTYFKLSSKNIALNPCEKTDAFSIPLYLTWNIDVYSK